MFLFVIGGLSGVLTAAVPLDWQLTDTYFVVAHLHYVLLGINVFPVIGGIYFWFPKFTGRMMSERIGRIGFWILFVGFNVAFFPMHIAGLLGMPRRIYTYAPDMGWNTVNMITSIGAFVFALGVLIFLVDFVYSVRRGPVAGDNPWDAPTLEWSTSSPPPPYNFAVAPRIASRHPLWEERLSGKMRSQLEVGYVLNRGREALGTSALDGDPDVILKMPEDSYAPFWLGVASLVFFTGLALTAWWLAGIGLLGCAAAIVVWLWPRRELGQRDDSPDDDAPRRNNAPDPRAGATS